MMRVLITISTTVSNSLFFCNYYVFLSLFFHIIILINVNAVAADDCNKGNNIIIYLYNHYRVLQDHNLGHYYYHCFFFTATAAIIIKYTSYQIFTERICTFGALRFQIIVTLLTEMSIRDYFVVHHLWNLYNEL